jgi:hypothetical protein
MILYFPDLDTLRLAMTSGVVPTGVSLAPAAVGLDEAGHIWVQPSVALSRTAQANLKKLGVQTVKENGAPVAEEVSCWPQLVPLKREGTPNLPAQAPVLFELPDATQLPAIVGEMLRLGNDRQSFRYVGESGQERVLLRVVGPPYYTLLRALERDGGAAPRAYVERLPCVWIEVGYAHPFVGQVQPPAGKMLLIRPPRQWVFLEDAPFHDIYEVLDFTLPEARVTWREGDLTQRITVPVRLTPGSSTAGAELWVVRERAAEQLDALVGSANDLVLSRLSFAVIPASSDQASPTVVLRARPSKQAPPALVLDCVSFRPFQKLPNLFVPCGSRLRPPLRRDAVRKLLADDPAQITWLYPQADGRFVPENLPDTAFQPLERWVDYVLDQEQAALQAWVGAAKFDFEAFVCKDDQPAKPRPPREPKKGPNRGAPGTLEKTEPNSATDLAFEPESAPRPAAPAALVPAAQGKSDELRQRRRDLEKQFCDLQTPLDAPERQELWREMALLNSALKDAPEAFICWANTLWEIESPPETWSTHWMRAEFKIDATSETRRGELAAVAAALDKLLDTSDPHVADARALAAGLVWAAAAATPPREFVSRLDRIQRYLEKHDRSLSVRGAWLAWVSLTRLAHGDVLGLARARDRLLERLFRGGLSSELDLPGFLRYSGHRAGERFRAVRERVIHLRDLAQHWLKPSPGIHGYAKTRSYVDLMFAFGLARLGEISECDRLMNGAKADLGDAGDVHSFLLEAFAWRIDQIRQGKGHGGTLPSHQLAFLEELTRDENKNRVANQTDDKRAKRFRIERLREHSLILEPHERIEAYRLWHGHHPDELGRELAKLPDIADRNELLARIRKLLAKHTGKSGEMPVTLARGVLEVAPRLGEAFCRDLIGLVTPTIEKLPERLKQTTDPAQRAHLLEQAGRLYERVLFLSAHYDQSEALQVFVERFQQFLKAQKREDMAQYADRSINQCLRGLRKFGLRDSIDRLLKTMADMLLQDKSLDVLTTEVLDAAKRGTSAGKAVANLQALLHVAAGWFYFGKEDQTVPILNAAGQILRQNNIFHVDRTNLTCSYVTALGQASPDEALRRVEALFRDLPGVVDPYTTIDHYCLSQLRIVEAVVLAVVNDDFAVGTEVRRWLDDDEYLVRRRIHHDMKMALAGEMAKGHHQ